MTETVYLLKTWQATPTYHDYGRIKETDLARSEDVTKCGLTMYDGEVRYHAQLRRDHADLFARPCRKCFPASVSERASRRGVPSALPKDFSGGAVSREGET